MKLFDMVDWHSDSSAPVSSNPPPTHVRKPSLDNSSTPTPTPPQLPRAPSMGSSLQANPSPRRSHSSMYSSGTFNSTTQPTTPAIDTSFFEDDGFAAFNAQPNPPQQFTIPPTSVTPPLPSVSPTPYNVPPTSVTPPVPSSAESTPPQIALQNAVDEQMKKLRLNDSSGEVQNWPSEGANTSAKPKMTRRGM